MPGNRGYKYFGAARDLPGVRELFETEAPGNTKKTRAELMKVSRLPSWAKSLGYLKVTVSLFFRYVL